MFFEVCDPVVAVGLDRVAMDTQHPLALTIDTISSNTPSRYLGPIGLLAIIG